MPEYKLEREQVLPSDLATVFGFFADAANLELMTPPWLTFRILTPQPIEMKVGTLIDYRLKLHGLPLTWRSEITAWEPGRRFVDEQLKGPYRYWIHEHEFVEVDAGVRVRDRVRYAVPGGSLVHRFFVAPDLEKIWSYRARTLQNLFAAGGPEAGLRLLVSPPSFR